MAEVSVVVPAHNASATLPATLRALAAQDGAGAVEVVVVDDASLDDTAAVAEAAGATVVRHERRRGPAASRNSGVSAASAPLLAFTDADCVPVAGWLAALTGALRSADLVRGPVGPPPGAPVGRFDRTLHVAASSPLFETANLAVTRAIFDAVGGFTRPGAAPEVAEGHIGEDVLFGWRAVRLGARTAFVPEARVHHAVLRRGPRAFIAERRRLRWFPPLVREVPELRDHLPGRVFLTRRTALFDLAVAGVAGAAAARRAGPLVLAAPYAAAALRPDGLWRRSAARENLAVVTADAVGLAALLRGSIEARRLLL